MSMLFDFILSQQSNLAPNKQHLLASEVLLEKISGVEYLRGGLSEMLIL